MVKTIFRNLIVNATKFTDTNGEITICAIEKEHFVEISIKDTGIGLSPEIITKLFDIDEIISLEGTVNETGTGLGLLLCKEFVEIEGGKIWVESNLGQGSEFKFTLPKNYDHITKS
jgi:signal transduction histidine kinase